MKIENKYYISNKGFLIGIRAIYDAINQEAFDGQLPKIPIKLYPIDNNTTNYQTAAAFCVEKETVSFKINNNCHSYGVELLSILFDKNLKNFENDEEFVNLFDYLFHEMIHEYCYLSGINDCNPETQYHNLYFMEAAENHGLLCWKYDEQYGFNHTIIPNDLFKRIVQRVSPDILKIMTANIFEGEGEVT